jgi:Sec-independent protein translocase protein TatA
MKTLKTFLEEDNHFKEKLPLWLTCPGEKAFKELSGYFIRNYITYIKEVKESKQEDLKLITEKIKGYKNKISNIQKTEDLIELLKIDVICNKDILKNLVKEHSQYLNYITKVLEDAKQSRTELGNLFSDILPNIISNVNTSLKAYKKQYAALINPEQMSKKEIEERVKAKKDLLAKDLGILEEQKETLKVDIEDLTKKEKHYSVEIV